MTKMARPIFVLALILIALVGLVSAADSGHGGSAAPAPANDDHIGNVGDDAGAPVAGNAVEGPLGSVEAAKAHAPSSGATATTRGFASAVAGAGAVAAVAGYFVM